MTDRLAATLALDESVTRVSGVSPTRATALAKLGVHTVRDLVTHFPRRYVDLSHRAQVAGARIGDSCTIQGQVHKVELKRPRPSLSLVEITLVDETGVLMVTCFRQPWLKDQLSAGMSIAVAGKVEFNYGFKRMTNPYLEVLGQGQAACGMIIPVHPACEKISPAWMRRLVGNALDLTAGAYDPLPLELRVRYRLMGRNQALSCIHFPQSMVEVAQARRRLVYEELLLLELMLMSESRGRATGDATAHVVDGPCCASIEGALPFQLTDEQLSARDDILANMAASGAMNHMLLGDVGTGKTAVAAFALAAVADTASQAALLAPTEVLARQHGKSLGELFDKVGVSWAILTGSTPDAQRAEILGRTASGDVTVLIGTHAILEDDVKFANLSLAVIDEQQRFGVGQREKLLSKGIAPDALYLTATPIPRTLALAVFGDMTLSYIKRRPHDSAKRTTHVVHKSDQGRAYDAAREALERGEQVYVVCPLIGQDTDERDKRGGGRKRAADEEAYEYAAISIESDDDLGNDDVAAATKEAEFLSNSVFADWNVELLHGRMKSAEKQQVMERFRTNETQVLVATTVIEVGVDVPNATVMIIQDADRFGLSQLHQLRGRVGRGNKPAQVFLVSTSKSDASLSRLAAMESTDDGFELAKYDLSLRREGDILGNRQHGASGLKLVNIVRDEKIIEAAHADAAAIMQADPNLLMPANLALVTEMRRTFGAKTKERRG